MVLASASKVWIDFNGFRTITRLYGIGTAAQLVGGFATLGAVSNASPYEVWAGDSIFGGFWIRNPAPAPVAADYQSGAFLAALAFPTLLGQGCVVEVPAPQIVLFLADQETIDPANPIVAGISPFLIAAGLCNANGDAINGPCVGGTLIRRGRTR